MITIIDLNHTKQEFPLLSYELVQEIKKNLEENKKTILFLNKRWEANSLVCKDCSHRIKCKHCDVSYSIHKYPVKKLICHHCNDSKDMVIFCPNCSSTNLIEIWIWTQKVEDNIKKLFPNNKILRIDSDKKNKETLSIEDIKESEIIISTELINNISIDDLWLVAFLLIEQEFVIPEYDIDEQIFANIYINKKNEANILIQTYAPNIDIIKKITEWNYKNHLIETLWERKDYNYPPYKELVYVWVKDKKLDRVKDIIFKLKNKLDILNNWENIIFFDKDIYIKRSWEYLQKIIIKWNGLEDFLQNIKNEILRNKEISIERK